MTTFAKLVADEIFAKQMSKPSLKLLSNALGLRYSSIIDAIAELNEGGAGIRLADIDVWARMINREPGWYWIRRRHAGTRDGGPSEWVPGYWTGQKHGYLDETWRAELIDLRSSRQTRDSGSWLPIYEDALEIIETPISEPGATR